MRTSAVYLDIGQSQVEVEVRLPLDRLAFALDRELTPQTATEAQRTQLLAYVRRHVSATGVDGAPWSTTTSGGSVRQVSGSPYFDAVVVLLPPAGRGVSEHGW